MKYLKILLLLFFISLNVYGQLFVSPPSVLNNKELFFTLRESILTNDSTYMVNKTFDGYRLFNLKTKESFYLNENDSLIDEYVCYIRISFVEMINKDIFLDRKSLIGNKEKFIIYGTNKCYCIYGELIGDTYKLIYTWDCN